MAGDEVEMKLLVDHGEQECGFDHGECGSETNPVTTAEWKIGEVRNLAGADGVFTPALGTECIRICEPPSVALRY